MLFRSGATLGIAVGTAVTNATTPTLPSIPQGTMILAQIDVEANVPAIISSNITDLRNFTGRLKGIQGNAGTGGVNGPATYMVDDGDEGPWGPPSSAVGPQGNPGAQGALGVTMAIPGDDGEDGLVVGLPGPQGNPGAQGVQGLTGPANMPGMDGVDGDDGMHIPGGVGPQGNTGAQGPMGPANGLLLDLGDIDVEAAAVSFIGNTTYPGAGIANSTGSAWGTSYTTSGTGTVVALATGATLVTPTGTGIKETQVAISASAIDLTLGNYFTKTISGTTTFTISNTASSGTVNSFILDLTNGGSATVTWWTGVKWAGGTAPTLTSSGRDVLGFFTEDGGTTWNGFVLGKAMA